MRPAFIRDQRGTSLLEFGLVGPVFLMLVIGMIYTCLLLFTMGSMQYAVEEGARCASVKTTVCTSSSTILSYTRTAYYGPVVAPSFTYSTPACGHAVTGSASFILDAGMFGLTVPLTATACFP